MLRSRHRRRHGAGPEINSQPRTPALRKRSPVASALLQECCGFDGGVGEDAVAAGALEGEQALHHHAIVIEPALGRGGLEHGVLAADIVGRSEEHTSELQSLMRISYAVFCLKQKIQKPTY